MKTKTFLVFLALVLMTCCTLKEEMKQSPLAQVKPVEEEYYGIKITDPYRYMENLQDTAVQNWLKAQSDYSRRILDRINGRQALIDNLKDFDSRKSLQVKLYQITDSDRYFYLKTTPVDIAAKLYYRDGFKGEDVLLYDPNTFSSDTTQKYEITRVSASIDGSRIAFAVAPNGSESCVYQIMDVKTRKIYPERIDRCWLGSPSWLPDGSGFLYLRHQSGDIYKKDRTLDSKTFLHKVDDDPSNDKEIFSRVKYPELGINPRDIPVVKYDKNCNFIFGYLATADNRLNAYYAPYSELKKEKIAWKKLFKPEDEVYNALNTEKEIYLYTPKNAPNFKIIKTSLFNPDPSSAEIVVPEDPQRKLTSFAITCDGLFYTLSENGVKGEFYFLPNGEKTGRKIDLPFAAGTIDLRTKGINFSDIWINLTGWTSDLQRYRYSTQNKEFILENLSSAPQYPECADLIVEELMVTSYDGVKVPLSLVYTKGIEKNGKNPVLLSGYGAYGISSTPSFDTNLLLWTKNGGMVVIAHVRGGGELGDQWYKAGFKATKPNTWKDLIACAEYLVNENYTSPKKIVINSASAGGILVGRALTERPDLFAAAIPVAGCLNTLRLEELPNGPVHALEFGTIKDSIECMALIEMDSYLKIKDGVKYPATLITAGMNDPRVLAWQPAKFAARLLAANASNKPILLIVDYEAGHGVGGTKTKVFEDSADILSFAFWQTDHPDYQIK